MLKKVTSKKVIQVPGGYFEDTNIATSILVLSKKKSDGFIEFEDLEIDKKEKVSIDEIKENDFNLSVSSYVQEEIEQEDIDIFELNDEVRRLILFNIEKKLASEFVIVNTFYPMGMSKGNKELLDFYNSIIELVEKYVLKVKGVLNDNNK